MIVSLSKHFLCNCVIYVPLANTNKFSNSILCPSFSVPVSLDSESLASFSLLHQVLAFAFVSPIGVILTVNWFSFPSIYLFCDVWQMVDFFCRCFCFVVWPETWYNASRKAFSQICVCGRTLRYLTATILPCSEGQLVQAFGGVNRFPIRAQSGAAETQDESTAWRRFQLSEKSEMCSIRPSGL